MTQGSEPGISLRKFFDSCRARAAARPAEGGRNVVVRFAADGALQAAIAAVQSAKGDIYAKDELAKLNSDLTAALPNTLIAR